MADYQLIPRQELTDLKKHIKSLKNGSSADVQDSVAQLSKTLNTLLDIFKTTAEELRLDDRDESQFQQHVQPIMDKMDKVLEQNKIIAEGVLALADMMKPHESPPSPSFQPRSPPPFPPQTMPQPAPTPRMAPPPPPPDDFSFPDLEDLGRKGEK